MDGFHLAQALAPINASAEATPGLLHLREHASSPVGLPVNDPVEHGASRST